MAVSISAMGRRPVDTVTYTTTDADNWVQLALPGWVRVVTVQSPANGAAIHVSTRATGQYAASDDQIIVDPDSSVTLRLSPGRAQANATTRTVSVHTGNIGDLVHVLLEEG